jgi:hypothetical protein
MLNHITTFSVIIFLISHQLNAQCLDFNVEESSGNDVFNARYNGIQICEDQKEITVGTERYYITRSTKNVYGEWIYYTQESRGYGWPEVGYVKVASTMDIIEVKFLAAIARYSVESPYKKAERERENQKRVQEEQNRRLAYDKKLFPSIDHALNAKDLQLAKSLIVKLNSPASYPRMNEYNDLLKKELIDSDTKQYSLILSKINNGDFNNARLEIRGLNYPDKFPHMSVLDRKEDEFLKDKILTLIAQEKFDEAVEAYDALNLPEAKTTVEAELRAAASNYYKSVQQTFSNEQLTKIVNDNKQVFSKLSVGEYTLVSDSEGNLSVNSQSIGIKIVPLSKSLGKRSSINVNTSAKAVLKINQTIINDGAEKILVSTSKRVFQTRNGKLYKQVFLGGPGYFNYGGHEELSVNYSSDIPKNTFKKVQPVIIQKTTNGILTEEKKDSQVKLEGKFKSRALTISFRALGLALWGGIIYLLIP